MTTQFSVVLWTCLSRCGRIPPQAQVGHVTIVLAFILLPNAMAATAAGPIVAFRIALSSLIAVRTDGAPEDDFKTFAQATVLTRGRPNATLWYASESDIQLAKTSVCRRDSRGAQRIPSSVYPFWGQVTNGFEAAYNYARDSKQQPATDEAVTELVQSLLLASLRQRRSASTRPCLSPSPPREQVHVYKGGARDAAKGDHLIGWFSTPLASLVDGKRVRVGGRLWREPAHYCCITPRRSADQRHLSAAAAVQSRPVRPARVHRIADRLLLPRRRRHPRGPRD